MKSIFTALLLFTPLFLSAQLLSGSMLGYADMKKVLICEQSKQAASVHIQYHKISDKIIHKTNPIHLEKSTTYTARIRPSQGLYHENDFIKC